VTAVTVETSDKLDAAAKSAGMKRGTYLRRIVELHLAQRGATS
jgi:predicted DNA-binding protein